MTALADPTLDLEFPDLVTPDGQEKLPLAEQFQRFHEANPHVARALESLADQWFAAGHDKVGVKALWERLRWEYGIRTTDQAPRLNNNYTAFYARVLLVRRPEWADRIATRRQKAVES